jgi:hypothetical protein
MAKKTIKKAEIGINPFVIEEGVMLTGRSGASIHLQQLTEAIRKLPVDKNISVLLPITICPDKKTAGNLVLGVRRLLSEDKKTPKNFTITLKTFHDMKKNYVNSRIWRIV